MRYRLIPGMSPCVGESYPTYRTEFDDPAMDDAYADLAGCDRTVAQLRDGRRMTINRHCTFWEHVRGAVIACMPRHCDDRGQWIYVDGQWHDFQPLHAEASYGGDADQRLRDLVSLHTEVLERFARAVPLVARCAGWRDGCAAMVAVAGEYCRRCQRDEE